MGAFYTNITLYGPDQEQVAQYLTQARRTAYVSPTVKKFTVVYDKKTEGQDPSVLSSLASQLSRAFTCTALAVMVHDSDVLMYWLYEAGKLTDEYNSMPDYFGEDEEPSPPLGGDAERLCVAFEVEDCTSEIIDVFQAVESSVLDDDGSEDYLFAEDIHWELAEILGIPSFAVYTGYRYIEEGEIPEELDETALVKCP